MKVIFEGNGEEVTGVKMESQGQQDEHNGGDSAGDITKFVIRSRNDDTGHRIDEDVIKNYVRENFDAIQKGIAGSKEKLKKMQFQ